MSSEPPDQAGLGSQSCNWPRLHRKRLDNARAAISRQQNELQAKLNAIDSELRAIDAYPICLM